MARHHLIQALHSVVKAEKDEVKPSGRTARFPGWDQMFSSAGRPCARISLTRSIKFSPEDIRKAARDATTPAFQPRNPNFTPTRSDEEGNVIFPEEVDIEQAEEWARLKALRAREELEPDTDSDTFFVEGSTVRKVYSFRPSAPTLSKSQKRKQRRLVKINAADSNSLAQATGRRPRRYIVDSGASFHLVDPRTLTRKEQQTIEDIEEPIPIETANGEVVVTKRCRVKVLELGIYVWAFLHEDTVCVLSLGLLVNRGGFSYYWKPGKFPELVLGKRRISCHPHFNVPFIYSSQARGDLSAYPSVPASANAPDDDDDDEDGLDTPPDLIPSSDSEAEEVPPVPNNPVPKRSRG